MGGDSHEQIQRHVILDVLRQPFSPFLGYGLEVGDGEGRVDVEFGELALVDDFAQAFVGGVGLEEVLQGDDGVGVFAQGFGRLVEQEFLEFGVEQFILAFEAGNEAEDLFEDFAQGEAAVDTGGT